MTTKSDNSLPVAKPLNAREAAYYADSVNFPLLKVPGWKFREMKRGDENQNPIHGQFFSTDALGDLNDVLVREACQNSIDAAADKKDKVKVYFHFRSMKPEGPAYLRFFNERMGSLWSHLHAEGNGLRDIPKPGESFNYLCVEDFGTIGLEGDPWYDDVDAPAVKEYKNHFFYFWRNIARNDKTGDKLGSWGVGKQVFPAASRINTYFGVTVRKSDTQAYLMGKSVLKIHHSPKKYSPFGYWGVFDEQNDPDFALPVKDHSYIGEFCTDFSLIRKNEPGLSLIVPYVKTDLWSDPKNLAVAAIRHYLYPIVNGKLDVYIGKSNNPDPDKLSDWYSITKELIAEQVDNIMAGDIAIRDMLSLILWGSDLEAVKYEKLVVSNEPEGPSDWKDTKIDDQVLNNIREEISINGKVAVEVPVNVRKKDGNWQLAYFRVFIGQTESQKGIPAKYIRQGLDIANVNKGRPLSPGYIAFLVVDDPLLAELLRDSEPPSHDNWEMRSGRLDGWEKGSKTIRFVIQSVDEIITIIKGDAAKPDPDLLRDIFSVTLEDSNSISAGDKPRMGGRSKERQGEPDIEPTQKTRYNPVVSIVKDGSSGGFKIYPPPDATEFPERIEVECAYMTAVGHPLKNYSLLDFSLLNAPVSILTAGANIAELGDNRMVVDVKIPSYSITVTGFDVNRDLYVRVNALRKDEKLSDS